MTDVHVIDTSCLIQLKDDLAQKKLWDVLKKLEAMVEAGTITFPKQVQKELDDYGVPDSISVWCAGVADLRKHGDPTLDTLSVVMKNAVVAKVVDWNSPTKADPADPYVLAQAYTLQAQGLTACVVTEDWKGKKDGNGNYKRSSLQMSCDEFKIGCIRTPAFLTATGLA